MEANIFTDDIFHDPEMLQHKCVCGTKIEYGLTTSWSDKDEHQHCKTCGKVV